MFLWSDEHNDFTTGTSIAVESLTFFDDDTDPDNNKTLSAMQITHTYTNVREKQAIDHSLINTKSN